MLWFKRQKLHLDLGEDSAGREEAELTWDHDFGDNGDDTLTRKTPPFQ